MTEPLLLDEFVPAWDHEISVSQVFRAPPAEVFDAITDLDLFRLPVARVLLEARGLHAVGMVVEPDGDGLEELAALVEAGALRVLVDRTFPLAEAPDAHRYGEEGRTTGKIVLVP